jgi:hypothetical protein
VEEEEAEEAVEERAAACAAGRGAVLTEECVSGREEAVEAVELVGEEERCDMLAGWTRAGPLSGGGSD